MAYGDIILYQSDGKWYEWFITHFTHGPYVHCSVDMGDGTNIAAHPGGISREKNTGGEVVSVAAQATPEDLNIAVEWLKNQIGKKYGWLDIISAGLHSIGLNIYLGTTDSMDCSDLCATYLDMLEGTKELIPFHHLDVVSPNDIARRLGILKPQTKKSSRKPK